MKIILVGPEIEENLGLRSLEAVLARAGHRVAVLPFNCEADLPSVARTILAGDPGLVGFSLVAQRRYGDFERLSRRLRSSGYKGHITAGGHFASLRAAEVLDAAPGIDTVLHHDGEERIVLLASWCEAGAMGDPLPDLDGITWRAPDGVLRHRPPIRVSDLDALPPPARRSPNRTLGFARAPLVASRGCSGACSFCSIHAWHAQAPATGRLRYRAPENVAAEMIQLHDERGVRVFIVHDDDFIHPDPRTAMARARAIFERAERGMKQPFAFVIKCRPDDIEADLFRYLKDKGLVRAYVGIETHSIRGLRTLGRRIDQGTNLRALETLRRLGVYSCFNLLLFHPDTTMEELQENLAFLSAHADIPFDVARTELYARSPLESRMIREGRALGDFRGYDYRISDPQAETVFRLFADAMWERHFGEADSILHLAQDLGYRDSLLARLAPRMASPDLSGRVRTLIRDVNEDTISHLRALIALAHARDFVPHRQGDPGLVALGREIAERIRARRKTWRALSLEIEMRAALARSGLGRIGGLRSLPDLLGRFALAAPSAAIALSALSCGGETSQVCDPPPPPIQYTRDLEARITADCATPSCHSRQSVAGGLVLSTGVGRTNMVEVPSAELPSLARVRPGKPDSSYVVHKMRGTQRTIGGSGDAMPPDASSDEELIGLINTWIDEGARDD
jgi:anaerobic magnesium-protoporphyrin IX monomethyl ester cyclase